MTERLDGEEIVGDCICPRSLSIFDSGEDIPREEEVVPEKFGEDHHGMDRVCSGGLIRDFCPHPEGIVLAEEAVGGIGSYSHLLVAGVWAERWDVDWV